jgi:hypothetical protein
MKSIRIGKKIILVIVAAFTVLTVLSGMSVKANAFSRVPWANSYSWSCLNTATGASSSQKILVTNYDPTYAVVTYDDTCGSSKMTGCVEYDMPWFNAGTWVTSRGTAACGLNAVSTAPQKGAYPDGSTDVFYLKVVK